MIKEKTPVQVYDELVSQGLYEEANPDKDEISKVKRLAMEDFKYGQDLIKLPNPNYRVIFNIHYDALRELCDQIMRFNKIKISNHQGIFAYIILNFKELDLDWTFFETIRTMRNKNKYLGTDITRENWNSVQSQIALYISAIDKWLAKRL